MKKVLSLIFAAALFAACGDGNRNQEAGRDADDNIENSDETLTPALEDEDSVGGFETDSLSSPNGVREDAGVLEDDEASDN